MEGGSVAHVTDLELAGSADVVFIGFGTVCDEGSAQSKEEARPETEYTEYERLQAGPFQTSQCRRPTGAVTRWKQNERCTVTWPRSLRLSCTVRRAFAEDPREAGEHRRGRRGEHTLSSLVKNVTMT